MRTMCDKLATKDTCCSSAKEHACDEGGLAEHVWSGNQMPRSLAWLLLHHPQPCYNPTMRKIVPVGQYLSKVWGQEGIALVSLGQ